MNWLQITAAYLLITCAALAQQGQAFNFKTLSERHDANGDGVISQAEFKGNPAHFKRFDQNQDGEVTEAEVNAGLKKIQWAQSQRTRPQRSAPEGVTTHRDIEFATIEGTSLKLDLYLPKSSDTAPPLIVWIHGGGWKSGDKANVNPAILRLSGEGYAVASINYRLKDISIHPKNIQDCKGAVRWLRANAATYGYDAERVAVGGSSAGGHLALLLGLSAENNELEGSVGGNLEQSSAVKAIVDFYGPSDLVTMAKESERFKRAHTFTEAQVQHASPLTYLSKQAPPLLIFHGDRDGTVPVAQSESIHERYQALGLDSELRIFKDAGHGGTVFSSDTTYQQIQRFLDAHL
ncbi:MAG: alpha/beta hydrolase fold domain-containing protein [Opitutaceae bacterium]